MSVRIILGKKEDKEMSFKNKSLLREVSAVEGFHLLNCIFTKSPFLAHFS